VPGNQKPETKPSTIDHAQFFLAMKDARDDMATIEGIGLLGWAKHDSLEWARHDSIENTRHRTDFEVLSILGQGGFGTAYKVRNRVDSRIYALKTVLLLKADVSKVLREVQVLSSLSSDNVVRYYGAWVEKGDNGGMVAVDDKNSNGGNPSEYSTEEWSASSFSLSAPDATTNPVCHLCQSTYEDWEVSFEHWGLIDAVLQPLDLCIPCYRKSIPPTVDVSKISVREKQVLQDYLFILMEFCESTLEQAVKDCRGDEETLWSYFSQCVQGLAYLHSKAVIHRDVKPSNVFVHEGVVKIGDLGLATIANTATSDENALQELSSSKSSQVGTFLYTSPEVPTGNYNEKCDVYSLGVLLVEMFSTFTTGMERVEVLSKLKSQPDAFPHQWVTAHPLQAELACQMAASDPANRPSCSQVLGDLLRRGVWKPPVATKTMENLVTDLTAQIAQLQANVEKHKLEALQLRTILDEHNIDHGHVL
jgi:translation initiation factor 2-alpha kinase 4